MMALGKTEASLILSHQSKEYYLFFILTIQFIERVSIILNILFPKECTCMPISWENNIRMNRKNTKSIHVFSEIRLFKHYIQKKLL